jgi:hypothetical protein
MWKCLCLSALLLGLALAADRPNLNGTWLLDTAHSQIRESKLKSETLEIHQKDNAVAIADNANIGGKDRKVEYECLADGSTCKAKDLSVMLYYNGPMLVVVEMSYNNAIVVQKSLKTSEDGKTLSMEVSHIAPTGLKDESLTFVKQ